MIIALGVEYLGSHYNGWQRQSHAPSVQQHVEQALSKIANQPIAVFCAGRTDSGVHGLGQVIHFETEVQRPAKAWIEGANCHLPHDISIVWAQEMPENFHARFSAVSREYRYVIFNSKQKPAVLHDMVTWVKQPLDVAAMSEAAKCLHGEQNYATFQAASCQSPTSFRNIIYLQVTRKGDYVFIDICANAFLHHMVRNIAGALIEVGKGWKPVQWMTQILAEQDRTKAAATAPASGLYFVRANYPKSFEMPKPTPAFWYLD
jgi:tRNA pseudouridine38-40 synthase